MTAKEYKKLVPEHVHLEGDELWNAMEDYLIQGGDGENVTTWQKGDPDIELSEEDEIEYQKCKKFNDEATEYKVMNYNRVWWKAFDKQVKPDKPTSTYQYMVFDVSNLEPTTPDTGEQM